MKQEFLFKHEERMDRKKVKMINFLSFLMGIGTSSLIYVISGYIEDLTKTSNVGIYFTFSYGLMLIILLNLHKLISRFGKSTVFLIFQIIKIAILVLLVFSPGPLLGTPLIVGYIAFSYITWIEMDAILESFSIDKMSGRIRGFYLLMYSLGYFIGPLASTQLLEKFGYSSVFAFGVLISSFFFSITLITFSKMKGELRENVGTKKLIKKIFSSRDLSSIYLVSLALEIFYVLMIIYMPLYLIKQGITWGEIGLIMSLVHLPFIFLQYPAGVLADKKTGEKELLILSLFIMGISTAGIYFIESSSFLVWAVVLMVTRVGASLVEILRDSYFYKKIDKRDIDLIDFYRTASPVAFIITPLILSGFLGIFSIQQMFVFVGMVILFGMAPAMVLKDNLHEGEVIRKRVRARATSPLVHLLKVLGRRFDVGRIIRTWRF